LTKETALTRKICIVIAVALAAIVLVLPSQAGRRTGTLKGKIVDHQGFPLSGAYIYVSSPSLVGIHNFITSDSGQYGLLELSPGTYRILAEMPGFKTVTVEGILLAPGGTVTTDFRMEPSEIEEEKMSREPPPSLDKGTARLAAVLDKDLLTRIPMPRDFSAVLGLVPGLAFANVDPGAFASVHGAPATANAFEDDGVNVTDPVSRTSLARINVDIIDQVVIETAALPADRGPAQGAYINVLRRSGGNTFDGGLSFTFTGGDFTKSLWAGRDPGVASVAAPIADTTNLDLSLTEGGPVIQDIGWFFTNLRLKSRSLSGPAATWQDPLGYPHLPYDWSDRNLSWTFKLSARATPKFRGTLEMDFSSVHQPKYESDIAWNRPGESTRSLSSQPSFMARAGLVYTMDQRTAVDLSFGYMNRRQVILLNPVTAGSPAYFDSGTGYSWGSGPSNDREKRKRLGARVTVTRLVDKALGAAHELEAGLDYESSTGQSSVWKADNLVMNYLNGNPYAFGQTVSPVSGDTVGTGWIGFSVVPAIQGALDISRELMRLGFFAQDTMNFGSRVVLSLGLRFDRSDAQFLSFGKGSVGNAVAIALGTNLIKPVYGFNPFSGIGFSQWDNVVTWNSLSPRFGLSFDLFGTGKTLLKGSFSRLPEELGLGYSVNLDPVSAARVHNFTWYDENGDGLVDTNDSYVMFPENYGLYNADSYKARVDPGLSAPMTNEWTAGFEHEITRDFSLAARYIARSQQGIIADVMYDPATGTPWYNAQGSPQGWWVPFTTTVPTAGSYPDTGVIVYFRSASAPAVSDRIQEVPELNRKYRGLELSFRKRMSHNWQLYGSVVWSRSTGTAGPASLLSAGISTPLLTPNSFVNVTSGSRTGYDQPLAIRLMGTLRFKYDIYLSAYYRFTSGSPWARTVTIVPPAEWAAEHNVDTTPVTVFLESPGTRRHSTWQMTDLRLEKEFVRGGRTRWSVYVDILNVFSNKYRIIDYNDGFWYPNGEGASSGTHVLSGTYGQAIYLSGTRTAMFSVRLGF
jgi:hypothetical protein